MKGIFESFDLGKVYFMTKKVEAKDLSWNAHPAFPGVALKHLIKGEDTEGKFSCHLVRIDPKCQIGDHIHAQQLELHEVVGGKGVCLLDNQEIIYQPGTCTVIPQGIEHRVTADQDGLYILAKFIPALV